MPACKACSFPAEFKSGTGETINNRGDNFVIIKNHEDDKTTYNLASNNNRNFNILEIRYCPMCGRNLYEED